MQIFIYIFIIIIACIIFATVIYYFYIRRHSRRFRSYYTQRYLKFTLIFAVIAIVSSVLYGIISTSASKEQSESLELSERIENVSVSLKNTSSELNAIQQELEQRIEFVEKLSEEAKEAEAMISLSKDQVEAVRSTLNKELSKSDSSNFWVSAVMSLFFLILGGILTLVLQKFSNRHNKYKNAVGSETPKQTEAGV